MSTNVVFLLFLISAYEFKETTSLALCLVLFVSPWPQSAGFDLNIHILFSAGNFILSDVKLVKAKCTDTRVLL